MSLRFRNRNLFPISSSDVDYPASELKSAPFGLLFNPLDAVSGCEYVL